MPPRSAPSTRCGDSGWEVRCRTCHDIGNHAESEDVEGDVEGDDVDLPSAPLSGCATSIRLRILGLTLKCWKCGRDTTCVAGLYPDRPSRTYVGIHGVDDERTMALVRQLLQ